MLSVIAAAAIAGCLDYGAQPLAGRNTPASEANKVAIQNFAFTPQAITINAGDAVTWVNQDSISHSIKSGTFNSGTLGNGASFQHTFASSGTYEYSCGIHPSMTGKVVVR